MHCMLLSTAGCTCCKPHLIRDLTNTDHGPHIADLQTNNAKMRHTTPVRPKTTARCPIVLANRWAAHNRQRPVLQHARSCNQHLTSQGLSTSTHHPQTPHACYAQQQRQPMLHPVQQQVPVYGPLAPHSTPLELPATQAALHCAGGDTKCKNHLL